MSERERRYWRSIEERNRQDDDGGGEFPEPIPMTPPPIGRRGFLKAAGFGLGGLAAGCSPAPVNHAIPFLVKPETVTPGRALAAKRGA